MFFVIMASIVNICETELVLFIILMTVIKTCCCQSRQVLKHDAQILTKNQKSNTAVESRNRYTLFFTHTAYLVLCYNPP